MAMLTLIIIILEWNIIRFFEPISNKRSNNNNAVCRPFFGSSLSSFVIGRKGPPASLQAALAICALAKAATCKAQRCTCSPALGTTCTELFGLFARQQELVCCFCTGAKFNHFSDTVFANKCR